MYFFFLKTVKQSLSFSASIQTPDHAHANGLKKCTENAFDSIGIVSMYQHLANLNVDGPSVNTGIHGRLGFKMKESALWINVIHRFNHILELAVKD